MKSDRDESEQEDYEADPIPVFALRSSQAVVDVESQLTWWQELRIMLLSDRRFQIYIILCCYGLFMITFGALIPVFWQGPRDYERELGGFSQGLFNVLIEQGTLLADFVQVGGARVCLVHSGVLMLIYASVIYSTGSNKYGYYFAATLMPVGYSMMGKNLYNIWPNFIGVVCFSRYTGKPLAELIPPLTFGGSLAPVVSIFSFHSGLPVIFGIIMGWCLGISLGFCLASLMEHMMALHRGFTLYNIGTCTGFLGVILYMIMEGFELTIQARVQWATEATPPLLLFISIWSLSMFILGIVLGGRASDEWTIMQTTGKLPSDYIELTSLGGALVNMGLMGGLATGYGIMARSEFNGPVIGGILTVIGFGALGKHPRNCIPIMLGVAGMGILGNLNVFYWDINSPTSMVAAMFCTSLAPVSGVFGPAAGFLVGCLHLAMASHIASIHGYMVLYNNGFAGGFVCVFFVGIINGLKPELLETVAPVAQAAPTWTKNISDAYQSYQYESMRAMSVMAPADSGDESFGQQMSVRAPFGSFMASHQSYLASNQSFLAPHIRERLLRS
eukprot:TRINITY_DN1312_c0_g2_i1.p1 TRINITY_DN1312_c0_g2~~TRINITY_DN1312_c0_g2_i1.p1  ORF type:complete len:559 (-),score=57.41 TRINITY_DN1312_c0_g2_i1:135-1811(-)